MFNLMFKSGKNVDLSRFLDEKKAEIVIPVKTQPSSDANPGEVKKVIQLSESEVEKFRKVMQMEKIRENPIKEHLRPFKLSHLFFILS